MNETTARLRKPVTFAGHTLSWDERGTAMLLQLRPVLQQVSAYQVPEGTWTAHVLSGTKAGVIQVAGYHEAQHALDALEERTREVFQSFADLLGCEVDHG